MTHAACPDCQVRLSGEVANYQRTCPLCHGPLVFARSAAEVLGYQRYFMLGPDRRPVGWDERRS
jgi:hypothetical protein